VPGDLKIVPYAQCLVECGGHEAAARTKCELLQCKRHVLLQGCCQQRDALALANAAGSYMCIRPHTSACALHMQRRRRASV